MCTPKMKMMAMDIAMCPCHDSVKHPAAENRFMRMRSLRKKHDR